MDMLVDSRGTEVASPHSSQEPVWRGELNRVGYRFEVRKVRPPLGVYVLFAGELSIFDERGTRVYREDMTLPAAVSEETVEGWRERALFILYGPLSEQRQ